MRIFLLFVAFFIPAVLSAQEAPAASYCGNQIVEGNEQCDDGNLNGDDGCTNYCYISSPKDPLLGAAVALGGALFVPVVGGSVGYLYAGEREKFKKMALLRAASGAVFVVGVLGFQASVLVGFNGGNADVLAPVAVGLLVAGLIGREVVDISCIIGSHAAIERYNERIYLYQEAKPQKTTHRLQLDLKDLSLTPVLIPTTQGSTLGGMVGLRF